MSVNSDDIKQYTWVRSNF